MPGVDIIGTQVFGAAANAAEAVPEQAIDKDAEAKESAHVLQLIDNIRLDKAKWKPAFEQMRRDMELARNGYEKKTWNSKRYSANKTGRHIRRKVAALYAKNPDVAVEEQEYLVFSEWDEMPESLAQAQQVMAYASAADPALPPLTPIIVEQSVALLEDYQRGMALKNQMRRFAKTLEVLLKKNIAEHRPVSFKHALKSLVRRASTCGVAYIELDMRRRSELPQLTQNRLNDATARLKHLQMLMERTAEGENADNIVEHDTLQHSIQSLQAEPNVIVDEGLVFGFPRSTKVIPQRTCKDLVGFLGCEYITIELDFTVEEVHREFGVDLKKHKAQSDLMENKNGDDSNIRVKTDDKTTQRTESVRVWKIYHKVDGLLYVVAEGYPKFLKPPEAPNVFVEDFWPVYTLTFNAVEHEDEVYPPSDVALARHAQEEHNRSRNSQKMHRRAAMPRYAAQTGLISDQDKTRLKNAEPLSVTDVNLPQGKSIKDVFDQVPIAGVDPNLYDTTPYDEDMQMVVGAPDARLGGVTKATATEAALAESSVSSVDNCDIDDLDEFLSAVIRAAGQILLRESDEAYVLKKCGPGALWPTATLEDISENVFATIKAGSTGRPNQASEIANWTKMLPFLVQMPDLKRGYLAQESIRRLDDKFDIAKAIDPGAQSIVAMNTAGGEPKGASMPDNDKPGKSPDQQGSKGSDNSPKPAGEPGSRPAMGSNQV